MSKLLPRIALAMTEHSICHPGRPGPHGDGQEGSPGLDAFHRAKSDADLRPLFVANAPDRMLCQRNTAESVIEIYTFTLF
jgi:hypothetical protein